MADLTLLSLHAPARREAGERGSSTEERTGIHAWERKPPTRLREPGQAERREVAYSRRGTVTLSAHFDVALGTVVPPAMGPTRPEEDFVNHRSRPVASNPEVTRWHCVAENLHMHQAEGLVRLGAKHDGIAEDLGSQEQRGMLKAMAPRAAFLSDPPQTLVFHDTPKPASWMHQIELWFRIVVRKFLKRASCTSGEA